MQKLTMAEIKQRLHQYIDTAEENKLEAIYTILENEIEGVFFYNEEDVKILQELEQKHLNGTSKSYTVEEAHDIIRKNRKKTNGL